MTTTRQRTRRAAVTWRAGSLGAAMIALVGVTTPAIAVTPAAASRAAHAAARPSAHPSASPAGSAASAARRRTPTAVARYAPLVWLARGEEYRPMSAASYLNRTELRWSHDEQCKDHHIAGPPVNAAELGAAAAPGGYHHQAATGSFPYCDDEGSVWHSWEHTRPKDDKPGLASNEGFFLDIPEDDESAVRPGEGTGAPVYFEYVQHRYVAYWFFYAYNGGPAPGTEDDHEGDWEHVAVQLDRHDRARTVAFYEHAGYCTVTYPHVRKSGSHPVVFSAEGSHAAYPKAGSFSTVVPGVRDHASKGTRWRTYDHLADALRQGWYGYGGGWGEVGATELSTGPLGPSAYKKAAPEGHWNKPCSG